MIFVLFLFIVLSLFVIKPTKNESVIKQKKFFKLGKGNLFLHTNKLTIHFFKECFDILNNYGYSVAKRVDEILIKLRYVKPRFIEKFVCPSYYVQSKDAQLIKALSLAKDVENFVAYSDKKCGSDLVNYERNKYKLQKLDFINVNNKIIFNNTKLNKKLIINKYNIINFNDIFQYTRKYQEYCIVDVYENEFIIIYLYYFYFNKTINYLYIKNKNKFKSKLFFSYFLDLVFDKYNYYDFILNENHIAIQNLLTKQMKVLNFSCKYNSCEFSQIENLKSSNLPCILLSYELYLKPEEEKRLFFSFSDTVSNLEEFSLKYCKIKSYEFLKKRMKFDITFNNQDLNDKLKTTFKMAKQEVICGKQSRLISTDFQSLLMLYKNNKISHLDFYDSFFGNLIIYFDEEIEIRTDWIEFDFLLSIFFHNKQKNIVVKKNCERNCFLVNGIRYSCGNRLNLKNFINSDTIFMETIS